MATVLKDTKQMATIPMKNETCLMKMQNIKQMAMYNEKQAKW